MQDKHGICLALPCGSDTYLGALPTCQKQALNHLVRGIDQNDDGCADPYDADKDGYCSGYTPGRQEAALKEYEHHCHLPNTKPLTRAGKKLLRSAQKGYRKYQLGTCALGHYLQPCMELLGSPLCCCVHVTGHLALRCCAAFAALCPCLCWHDLANVVACCRALCARDGWLGCRCVECGWPGDGEAPRAVLPCDGAHFGGCFVNKGYILNEDTVRCPAPLCAAGCVVPEREIV